MDNKKYKFRNNPQLYIKDESWGSDEPTIYDKTKRLAIEDAFNCMYFYAIKFFNYYSDWEFGALISDILFMGDEPHDSYSWKCWEDVVSDYLDKNEIKNPELSVVDAYTTVAYFLYDYFLGKYSNVRFSKMILEIEKMYNNKNKDKVHSLFKKNIVRYESLK